MEDLVKYLKSFLEKDSYILETDTNIYIILGNDKHLYYLINLRFEIFILDYKEYFMENGIVKTNRKPVKYFTSIPDEMTKTRDKIYHNLSSQV